LELEIHDARQEWGEHESVTELINADVRPSLQECLDIVSRLIASVSEALTRQEESQHHVVTQLIAFFQALAKKQEMLKKRIEEFEMEYKGAIEDCEKDHEEASAENETRLSKFHADMDDAAHHTDLDKLKQEAFDHLDFMVNAPHPHGYRNHAEELMRIHNKYPGDVSSFFLEQTTGFCDELGLDTVKPPPSEGEAGEKSPREAAGVDQSQMLDWEEGFGSGCRVLERLVLPDFRESVVGHAKQQADAEDPADPADQVAEAAEKEAVDEIPKLADGTLVLEALEFDAQWLEGRFGCARTTVFTQLTLYRKHLDRIDVVARCEEVRQELDQRLRRHTNRKGEVQVEWYVPRYGTISKHKDKFERHLIDIARKSQSHDDQMEEFFAELNAKEQTYQEKLTSMRDRFAEAETLTKLTACERQALSLAQGFKDTCQQIKGKLMNLATKAPQGLQKENQALLTMCQSGDEKYSQTEICFYSSEIEELNGALEKRAHERAERVRELETKLDDMREVPLKEFREHYDQAKEHLCATKGYGPTYGEPRRKAQERCRTLISRAATVKQNVQNLLDYFSTLCDQPIGEGAVEFSALPRCPLFRLKDLFRQYGSDGEPPREWVFTAELVGVFYIIVCTIDALGSHLAAFTPERAANYALENVPMRPRGSKEAAVEVDPKAAKAAAAKGGAKGAAVEEEAPYIFCVLREEDVIVPAEDETRKAAELALREDCLMQTLVDLRKMHSFNDEVQSIVKASHEIYASRDGGTPEFMNTFLSEMQTSAERARQEAARGVREWSDKLRDDTLLRLGDALFGELTARSVAGLFQRTRSVHEKTMASWAEKDSQRALHEQRLSPRLSNPNAETELLDLIDKEAQRYKSAILLTREDRGAMASCLRAFGDLYVQRLAARFEAAIRLLDSVPLHGHFGNLPGDEQVEPPRMSIKRRMRHLKAGHASVDEWGDGLPERTWAGIPRYELRGTLRGSEWPEDPDLAEATEEVLAELSPNVESYRSPVHRTLSERRFHYYARFKEEFLAEVSNRNARISAREEKERVGQRNWLSMVKQLNGDVEIPDIDAELEAEARAIAEEKAAAAAAAAAAADPKGKKK